MPNLSKPVTFLFAGDGSLSSDGLSAFLQTKSNFLMLSECSDGATAISDIHSHLPEIAVIDAQLPDMSAQQIIKAVRTHNRDTKMIVLGASADRTVADELLSAGADAYIVRSGPSRHLNEAIRYVRDGGKYLSPELTKDLPAPARRLCDGTGEEASCSLRTAIDAQALTVQRLEHAMDRAQYALDVLQQKVERLTGAPLEPSPGTPSGESARGRRMPGIRSSIGAAAATVVMAVLVLQFSGILRPAHASQAAQTTISLAGLSSLENARSLLANQQYTAAATQCRLLLKQNPANTAAGTILAAALLRQSRVSESTAARASRLP